MPSKHLNSLYETARESLPVNVQQEIKIALLNTVINQANDEIKICNDTIRLHEVNLFISPPSIHQRIEINNEIKFANIEKSKIIKLKEEVERLICEQQELINQSNQPDNNFNESAEYNRASKMKIFISHSEKDKEIAESFIMYLQSALLLVDDDIRCTSVLGHKIPFGKSIAEILRDDLALAPTLIVLVTEESIKATWVMFELGAAWGLKKDIVPILSPGIEVKDLPSLLSNVTCILIDKKDASSMLSGLVSQLSNTLKLQPKHGEKTQANLEKFVNLFRNYGSKKGSNLS